jgi:hypothetical protein
MMMWSKLAGAWNLLTLDNILCFPTQKYIVIKDKILVCYTENAQILHPFVILRSSVSCSGFVSPE